MREIFVISDTHFGHNNIIRYCNRPFSDVSDMNTVMIDRWNKTVRPQDIVYHLGDVYFGEKGRCLEVLNGHKRLILGNHDNGKDQYLLCHFEKILVWRMFPEFKLLLTHVPVHYSQLKDKCPVNVHGHVHNNPEPGLREDRRYKNVSVEMINYTPVHISELTSVR